MQVENVFCAANDGFDHKVNLLKFSTITCLLSLLECVDPHALAIRYVC